MGVLAREAVVGFEQGEHNHVKQVQEEPLSNHLLSVLL